MMLFILGLVVSRHSQDQEEIGAACSVSHLYMGMLTDLELLPTGDDQRLKIS